MALINCSECGRQISSQAWSCPQCGMPISPPEDLDSIHFKKKDQCVPMMVPGVASHSSFRLTRSSSSSFTSPLIIVIFAIAALYCFNLAFIHPYIGPSTNIARKSDFQDVGKGGKAISTVSAKPVKTSAPRTGEMGKLRSSNGDNVSYATSNNDLSRLIRLSVSHDLVGIEEMLMNGSVRLTPDGTACRVIKTGLLSYEVRIMDGPRYGDLAFVPREDVRSE